jgi:hypothetical protein
MEVRIVGQIASIETIAEGSGIRELPLLRARYGLGRWRKKKGIALVQLPDGTVARAEVHWYEAHGIGRVKMKIKEWL